MKDFEAGGARIVTPLRDVPGLFTLGVIEDLRGTTIEVVQDPELVNRLKNERRAFATHFELSDGQKFRVTQLVVSRLIQ